MTNNELYELFREHNIRNYCRGTHSARNSCVKRHFLPKNGYKNVCDTSVDAINTVYDDMEAEGYKRNTIYGTCAAMSAFFVFAIVNGEAHENPVRSARKIRQEK